MSKTCGVGASLGSETDRSARDRDRPLDGPPRLPASPLPGRCVKSSASAAFVAAPPNTLTLSLNIPPTSNAPLPPIFIALPILPAKEAPAAEGGGPPELLEGPPTLELTDDFDDDLELPPNELIASE